jgi:cell division cycle 2-like protein
MDGAGACSDRSPSPIWSSYEFDGDSPDVPPHKTLRGALSKIACLRRGSQGAVYLARDRSTGELVAVKRIFLDFRKQRDRGYSEQTIREVSFLSMLSQSPCAPMTSASLLREGSTTITSSRNIIKLRRVVVAPGDEVCAVMERCPTDLAAVTVTAKSLTSSSTLVQLLTMDWIRYVMWCLLQALDHLHRTAKIIHRDVKPGNILLTEEGDVRLSDFGSARMMLAAPGREGGRMTPGSLRTTLLFASPEALMGAELYGPPSDMWSCGVTFAELLLRDHLFKARSELVMISSIFQLVGTPTSETWGEFAALPVAQAFEFQPLPSTLHGIFESGKISRELKVTAACKDLLSRMLVANPAKRITAEEALRHPFFAERDDGSALVENSSELSWIPMKERCAQIVRVICDNTGKRKSATAQLMLSAEGDESDDE